MSSISRTVQCARQILHRRSVAHQQPKRSMGGAVIGPAQYRNQVPEHSRFEWILASIPPAAVVFTVGFNMYHHWKHLVGDYPEIVPEKFTDEELGIPPDDVDVYPKGYKPKK